MVGHYGQIPYQISRLHERVSVFAQAKTLLSTVDLFVFQPFELTPVVTIGHCSFDPPCASHVPLCSDLSSKLPTFSYIEDMSLTDTSATLYSFLFVSMTSVNTSQHQHLYRQNACCLFGSLIYTGEFTQSFRFLSLCNFTRPSLLKVLDRSRTSTSDRVLRRC